MIETPTMLAAGALVGAVVAVAYTWHVEKQYQAERERGLREIEKLRAAGLSVPEPMRRRRRPRQRLAGASARRIADLAAILAGRRRGGLGEEWRAHLAGEPGRELPPWQKARAACGFVVAAVRYRLQDAADLAWVPADAILKSRMLSNLVVWVPTVGAVMILFHHGGLDEVLADAESILAFGGALYGLIRIGRWWRGVKPQDPKVRGVNE